MSKRRSPRTLRLPEGGRREIVWKGPVMAGIILVAALLGGGALRGIQGVSKQIIISDEGISFLAATGHQAEYDDVTKKKRFPYGEWVPASEWKRFITLDDKFCFRRIGADLARTDIHPPLYFWILHLWAMVFGIHMWTGPVLNTLVAAATTLVLFALGREVLGDSVRGGLVAFVWALSPTVIASSLHARQYELLGLCTAVFVWQVLRCGNVNRHRGWRPFVMLALVTAAGLLTHYHFPLLVLGSCFFLCASLLRTNRRRLLGCCASIGAGGALFAVLHPHFLQSLGAASKQAQAFALDDLGPRGWSVMTRYSSYFVDTSTIHRDAGKIVECIVLVLLILLTVKVVASYVRARTLGGSPQAESRSNALHVLVLFAWTAGTNIFLYLAGVSPEHAMQARHVTMVYPLFALVSVMIVYSFSRRRAVLAPLLCVGLLVSGAQSVRYACRHEQRLPSPSVPAAGADTIVINNPGRILLPAALMYLPDDVLTLAASPEYLEIHQREWAPRLGDNSLWFSYAPAQEDRARLTRIGSRLAREYEIVQTKGHVAERGTLVTFRRRVSANDAGGLGR